MDTSPTRRNTLPAIALAVLNSLVQLLGVLVWGWPIGNIFLLLWVENVIVTLIAVARVTGVKAEPGQSLAGQKAMTSFGMLFFCAVHGVFSVVLAFMTGLDLTAMWFLYPLILLVVRYVVEAISWFARYERPQTIAQAHGFAMRRIIMLHVAIIACWFVIIFGLTSGGFGPGGGGAPSPVSLPLIALSVLLVIKTLAEIASIGKGPNVESSWKFQA